MPVRLRPRAHINKTANAVLLICAREEQFVLLRAGVERLFDDESSSPKSTCGGSRAFGLGHSNIKKICPAADFWLL